MIATEVPRNPFATRHVRPGRLDYVFAPGESVATILARWQAKGCCGAIVGPHGTGKSTLLAALIVAIEVPSEQRTFEVRAITLHDGQRKLPADFALSHPNRPRCVIVIDGYEQLGWFARRRLLRSVHRSGWGLLVTAHSSCGIPVVHQTESDLSVVKQLVARLLPSDDRRLIDDADVQTAFASHAGNVRETLFALYDLWETRSRVIVAR